MPEQVAALAARTPDIVALQEVTASSAETLRTELPTLGLTEVVDSFLVSPPWRIERARRYAVLLASRWPLAVRHFDSGATWPERIVSAAITTPSGDLTLHTTHIPPGCTNGWTKIHTIEAVLNVVAATAPAAQILCGDFNVPQKETSQGRIVTWGERISSEGEVKMRRTRNREPADRWDRAERGAMQGHPESILIDAYRRLHGYTREDVSWIFKKKALRVRRRFDHAFCSPQFRILSCEYLHEVREQGLSDHSALELDFDL